ncbi:MAG: YfhO family protein [Ignavibacterium sp.]|nr:YfhO family protein [Ignavibacterium sp.]
MAKAKKVSTLKKTEQSFFSKFSLNEIIPQKYHLPVFLSVILIVFLVFLNPLYFGGKTFMSGDIVTIRSMEPYLEKEREEYTLWNPYVFLGMPAYTLRTGDKDLNLIWLAHETIKSVFMIPFEDKYVQWSFYLILLAYSMFFFFYNRTRDKLISLFVGLATGLSTGLVVFLYIGHVTKLTSLAFYPLIFLMLYNFQKKIRIVDFFLLVIILYLFVKGWHVQIIFYSLFAIGIYFIFYFIHSMLKKDNVLRNQIFKSAVVFFFAIVFAVAIQSDSLTQVYEYAPASTRGTKGILEAEAPATAKSESDFYQYATNWSFSPGEIMTFIIPSYYGFGKSVYQGPLSQNQPVEVNTYFGQMPFVDVAQYMGVIIFFLALFSMFVNWRDPLVKFLTILSFIALLISFGRTLPFAYDLMFYYFPFFDKFRVPSMILIVMQMSFPVLAGLGILRIIQLKDNPDKRIQSILKFSAIGFGVLFVFGFLLESSIKEWFIARVIESGQKGTQLQPIHGYMADMFAGDFKLAFFFSAAVFGLAFAFTKNLVSKDILIASAIIFTVIDLFRINHRGETYIDNEELDRMFSKPDYISAIESLNDQSVYRLLNLKQDGSMGSVNQNSNFHAYFLKQDVYGYSGIKPRAYQDYMDVLGGPTNPTFWRMINAKYFIFDNPINFDEFELKYSGEKTFLYENKSALPRAYFVDRLENRTGIQILTAVKNNTFDPKEVAYLSDDTVTVDVPDSTAFVNIERYEDERIVIKAKASGNNFLFLGDNYVPVGWKATIDDNETKIYKVNHGFRGIVVPEGEHTIVFTYLPKSFVISKNLALALSSIAFIGLIIGLVFSRKRNRS